MTQAEIIRISGPLVVVKGLEGAKMYDVVKVGEDKLIGEIVELKDELCFIQVYEETSGLGIGEPVYSTHQPLSVELGPGLVGSIYDGIQRPLDILRLKQGDFIHRGLEITALDREKLWHFIPCVEKDNFVQEGDILGEVQETNLVIHKIMVPPSIKGKLLEIKEGDYKVTDTIAKIDSEGEIIEIKMLQIWPVRKQRPIRERLVPDSPLITGQRVIDTFFPVAKGGTACIPGPFGSGKTVCQHQLAKWSDANIIVYVACGERGNEAADVLLSFPQLKDPYTQKPLMERTIIVANTSNMPVAAREASIYTGITIAEYFRDMGYSVALMADSTSRWAEALREISGRLEQMPGEEGYPADLSSRISEFYERAGKVYCLGKDKRIGSLSIIGAVSPPGGDLSDPVVQSTLRVVKVFWALDDKLANARHFPAINWLLSYSLYLENIKKYLNENISEEFIILIQKAMRILEEENELLEIVRLVGEEALSERDKLILHTARSIREDFLHQNAFQEMDTYTSLRKQYLMLKSIILLHGVYLEKVKKGSLLNDLISLELEATISRMKYIKETELDEFQKLIKKIKEIENV
ncbi:MAG: V-type ATP synthase subunit A [Candidatus Omnitrophica bacterium]|nr:V-type ATP synthase subunit A [Candidatus Omnitrophota bacterium]